jgi:hypothetical protein
MQETIYATFADPSNAERAAGALLDNGVRQEDLTIVQHYNETANTTEYRRAVVADDAGEPIPVADNYDSGMTGMPVIAPEYAASPTEPAYSTTVYAAVDENPEREGSSEKAAKEGLSTTTGGDAGIGAAKGAGWGLGIGTVAALASLFIPGIGLVIGGGALATAIGAAAATTGAGAIAGGVTGYLKDQGYEEHDGKRIEEVVKNGGALLGVSLPSGHVDFAKAWEIIDKYNGAPISEAARNRTSYLA